MSGVLEIGKSIRLSIDHLGWRVQERFVEDEEWLDLKNHLFNFIIEFDDEPEAVFDPDKFMFLRIAKDKVLAVVRKRKWLGATNAAMNS